MLSYTFRDTRNDMQDVIDQILKSPSSYAPHQVHNVRLDATGCKASTYSLSHKVLNLMKSCLAHAAPEFVTFCIAQLQFMQAGIGSPGEYSGELANQPNAGPMLIC